MYVCMYLADAGSLKIFEGSSQDPLKIFIFEILGRSLKIFKHP